MKLLLFADLHLDAPFTWLGRDAGRRRRQVLRDALGRIVDLAGELGVGALLCGGDLYEHDRFSADTGEFVRGCFARLHPLPIYVAPGNHDWLGPQSLYRTGEWSPNVHVFGSDRLAPVTLEEGLTLWGAAHLAPANTDDFLHGFRVDRGGVHLALFHGSERGGLAAQGSGKVAHAPFAAEEIVAAGLDHAFVGHYHFPRDAERHTYPGSPVHLSFADLGERGVVIAEVGGDGGVVRERRRVSASEAHDLTVDLTGCASQQDVRDRLASAIAGMQGLVRVTLFGELGSQVDLRLGDLEDRPPGVEALLVRIGDLRVAYDFASIAREPTVRGQFVRDVLAAHELSEQRRARVLVTGLRALEGRDDLEVL